MPHFDLVIASDHAGFELKTKIIGFLETKKLKVLDLGADNQDKVDYPDFAKKLVDEITQNTAKIGILICASGIGMSIAANRHSEIRAALCTNEFMAERARLHNDANILVLGGQVINEDLAFKMIEVFLNTSFEGGRHAHRLLKI